MITRMLIIFGCLLAVSGCQSSKLTSCVELFKDTTVSLSKSKSKEAKLFCENVVSAKKNTDEILLCTKNGLKEYSRHVQYPDFLINIGKICVVSKVYNISIPEIVFHTGMNKVPIDVRALEQKIINNNGRLPSPFATN